jgi:hypothetical protein
VAWGETVQREWEPEDLISAWTLLDRDWQLVGNKTGPTRPGFALMLTFYEIKGRFPAYPEEVPPAAVEYVASLVKVSPVTFAKYSMTQVADRRRSHCRAPRRARCGRRAGTSTSPGVRPDPPAQ